MTEQEQPNVETGQPGEPVPTDAPSIDESLNDESTDQDGDSDESDEDNEE
jgi:hypothetical protein